MASDQTVLLGRPVELCHVAPLSVERNTPLSVPANNVEGVVRPKTSDRTWSSPSPVERAVHVAPLSVERNTPPPFVPAYRVDGIAGSTASDRIVVELIPAEQAVHVAPLSVERKTPPSVPTYRVDGFRGFIAMA